MTHHREQCRSVPPKTPTVNGVYHRHYCIHDATLPFGTVLEHVCRCGLTWTDEPYNLSRRLADHRDIVIVELLGVRNLWMTEEEIDDAIAEHVKQSMRAVEPIPPFAECGRPWCDLREKRLEHGHFGDRPSPYLFEPVHRPDPWGIWPLILIIATVAASVGLAVEVWR